MTWADDDCYICPGEDVVIESGHVGRVVQVIDTTAEVRFPLLGTHWVAVEDLDLVTVQTRRP